MARSADSQKVREWQQRMLRFQRSQQSVARFCRDEKVSVPSFYQWRKKLLSPAPAPPKSGQVAAGFTSVRLVAVPTLTVRWPGGTQLDVPAMDALVLQRALDALAQVDAQRCAGGEAC